jgi:DNA-binding transcriptional MerR regulator
MRSGELAKRLGISPDTLRHYERKGLLAPPQRTSGGYRVYGDDAVERILLVRRALGVGFGLDDLSRIFAIRDSGGAPCRKVRALAGEKLVEIEQRIRDLRQLQKRLRRIASEWDDRLAQSNGGRASLLESLPIPGIAAPPPLKPKRKPRNR